MLGKKIQSFECPPTSCDILLQSRKSIAPSKQLHNPITNSWNIRSWELWQTLEDRYFISTAKYSSFDKVKYYAISGQLPDDYLLAAGKKRLLSAFSPSLNILDLDIILLYQALEHAELIHPKLTKMLAFKEIVVLTMFYNPLCNKLTSDNEDHFQCVLNSHWYNKCPV